MTVGELIQKLQAFDRGENVFIGKVGDSCQGRVLDTINRHESNQDHWVTLVSSD